MQSNTRLDTKKNLAAKNTAANAAANGGEPVEASSPTIYDKDDKASKLKKSGSSSQVVRESTEKPTTISSHQ